MNEHRMFRAVAVNYDWMDERSVVGRIFPFGESAHIVEPNDQGQLEEYDEEFLPGCTDRMRQVAGDNPPRWVRFTLDHEQDFSHRVGYCRGLVEHEDGVYAGFELYEGAELDKARSMLRTSHTGLSIEFHDTTKTKPTGTLRQRRQIQIHAVTATPIPAYSSARVLAVREGDPFETAGTPRLDAVRAMLRDV